MNARIVLGPTEYLIGTIVSLFETRGRDFSSTAVVFPGRRPGNFLRKELASHAGGSIIPPKIFSLDDFICKLYEQLHPEPLRDLDPIDAAALLHIAHKEVKERLGGEYFEALDAFIPIGIKLFGELEELRLANKSERELKETVAALTYNRLFSLVEYYKKFYALVQEKGFTTRAVRYVDVAEHMSSVDLSSYTQILIVGSYKPTHTERVIYGELEKCANTQFIFQTAAAMEDALEPEIHFTKAPDIHGQVFALSGILRKELEQRRPINEHSVIVLPSADALFPVMHQTLSLLPPDQYNIALEYPIARTPIYAFLYNLMELLCTKQGNRYAAARYIQFILHPYTKNIRLGQRTDITRILFHAIESMLVNDKSKIFVTLEDIEECDEIFTNVAQSASEADSEILPEQVKKHLRDIHTSTIRMLEENTSVQDFAHHIIDVLTYIYDQSTARLHPLFRPYSEALLKVFLTLEESFIAGASFPDNSGYFNFLQQYVALQNVPFSGTPLRGLQVLGLLETRNLQFDDVYFLNVNENVLPGGPGSDMLLPQQLRETLGLETRRDRDDLSEYYFRLLVRSAKRVHLFFSESGENEKSRFVEQLLWERQKRDGTSSAAPYIHTVRYQVNLANEQVPSIPKSDAVRTILQGFTFSASALDTYLHCPIQFYFRYLMRMKEKEEASADVDSQDIGNFVHGVLKNFFAPCIGRKLESQDLLPERMKQVVEEMFAQEFGAEPAGAAYLLKRQILRQLENFLTAYQQPMTEENEIILKGVEEKISINTLGARFEGRLDRIEQRGETLYILDYKTGARLGKQPVNFSTLDLDDRTSWTDAVTSLQLPMYLLLYSTHIKTGIERIIPANLFLGKNQLSKDCEVPFLEEREERIARFEQVKQLIVLILKEINDKAIPFSPPADLSKTCPRCPYTGLCGTAWVQGWKV